MYSDVAMTNSSGNTPELSLLGKAASYKTDYDASLLFPIPRLAKREEIGIGAALPFFGVDIWNAYELSWLNCRGKPQVALAKFTIPADSPCIIESKSFKLYLNSFNQTRVDSTDVLQQLLQKDISAAAGAAVQVSLMLPEQFSALTMHEMEGALLDRLDIDIDQYSPAPELLTAQHDEAVVEETLVSHLLKSNCLVTGQPDWGSVQIQYVGPQIDQEGLLRYLIGFRNHNEFHEQCVERIFVDIMQRCKPQKLTVYARYTRRGGLDINPWRSNFSAAGAPDNRRHARQ